MYDRIRLLLDGIETQRFAIESFRAVCHENGTDEGEQYNAELNRLQTELDDILRDLARAFPDYASNVGTLTE